MLRRWTNALILRCFVNTLAIRCQWLNQLFCCELTQPYVRCIERKRFNQLQFAPS